MANREIVSDYTLRQLVNQFGLTISDPETGADSQAYKFAKFLRAELAKHTLEGVWSETAPWSDRTFPQSTPQSIANHLLSEAQELAENPYDAREIADIALLLGHLASRVDVDVASVAYQKYEINQKRDWGKPNEKGFVEHVRQEGEQKKEKRPTIEVDALWHETVYEVSKGKKTGRTGTILYYRIGGRTFAKEPVWNDEPQTTEMRPVRESDEATARS